MKVVKGNFGKCLFVDCLSPEGLPSLKEKEYELVFTDPPWGYEYDGTNPKGINQMTKHPERINYDDSFNGEFNLKFYNEMKRVSKAQVMIMGRIHLFWWIRNTDPIDLFTIVFKNGQNSTKISKYNGTCQFVCYGDLDFWKEHKFHRNFYETYIRNGYLRFKKFKLIHPSPKDFETWNYLISDLKPASICDPFGGSCCIGEVAEYLGIKWISFEINEDYYEDVYQRVNYGMEMRNLKKTKKLREF